MLIHITRHGQVLPSGDETWSRADYPPGDPPLSALGQRQAQVLGQRLAAMGFCGRILSSPYRRTLETACGVADQVDCTVTPSAPLREIVKKVEQMHRFVGMDPEQLDGVHERVRCPAGFPPVWWTTNAETDSDVEARVAVLVDELLQQRASDVLLVGHGASTGGVIDHLLRTCAPESITAPTPGWNCALTSFEVGTEISLLRRMDTDHLPADHVTSNAQSRADVEGA